jgi:alpha-galactosidase
MRADYAMLARLQMQSTSDQQDYVRYPPIAAAAPASIAPEQAAVWAYPQPGFTDDEIMFVMAGAMLGRIHLSGHLDRMSARQLALVTDAVRAYQEIRAELAIAVPFWPLGLPGWTDPWIALGLRAPGTSYLTVWHRGPATAPARLALPVPHLRGERVTPRVLYPGSSGRPVWDRDGGLLTVSLPAVPSACVLALDRQPR